MGLFSKKPSVDLGQYRIATEIVLMNFHDTHVEMLNLFEGLADVHCEADGLDHASVMAAVTETIEMWEEVEQQINARINDECGMMRDHAEQNGQLEFYDDYVLNRIGMLSFTIRYRLMNAYTAYCDKHGIELSSND